MEIGNHFLVESSTGRLSDEEELPSDKVTGGSCDKEFSFSEEVGKKSFKSKTPKSIPPKKRSFSSWGSEELMSFLACIGRNTSKPYTHHDTTEIVKRYVYEHNLLDPIKKKKRVLCDDKLHSLFMKKTVKLFKIHDLLESHFAANEDSEDDLLLGLEDEDNFIDCKRKSRKNSDAKRAFDRKNCATPTIARTSGPRSSCYASLSDKNIKLVFLRRSLVQDLLKKPDLFEAKVVGSFVRVKNDPKDCFHSLDRVYQLGQVTSIRRTQEAYKIGDIDTDFVLRISNIWKDVCISMLSEDDFEEIECENLRQLVKKGLHPRPLIIDFVKKVTALHKDITIHWIERELAILAKKIDRANEKGWRREFFDLIERRKLLSTPAEQERLIAEIPEVASDEEKLDGNLGSEPGSEEKTQERKVPPTKPVDGTPILSSSLNVRTDIELTQILCKGKFKERSELLTEHAERMPIYGISEVGIYSEVKKQKDADSQLIFNGKIEENQEIIWTPVNQTQLLEVTKTVLSKKEVGKEQENTEIRESAETSSKFTTDLNSRQADRTCPSEVQIIDLEDDETENENSNQVTGGNNENAGEVAFSSERNSDDIFGWHYLDPAGIVQGPFTIDVLRLWREQGFFDNNFRVWKHGRPQDESVLLLDAFRLYS